MVHEQTRKRRHSKWQYIEGNKAIYREYYCSTGRRKTSKYFSKEGKSANVEDVSENKAGSANNVKPGKKIHKLEDNDDDGDFVTPTSRKGFVDATPNKMLKSGCGEGLAWKIVFGDDEGLTVKFNAKSAGSGEKGSSVNQSTVGSVGRTEDMDSKDAKSVEPGRQGGGGRVAPAGGRCSRGGGFMNFGERKDPPHKGEKEVPEGASDCLNGYTFVISGTLDSLEREEAEDLIKHHGGRITGSVSKKTNYLLCDEDIGGRKSAKAKELGTIFITEDGLFDMIRASSKSKNPVNTVAPYPPKKSPQKSMKSRQASSDTRGLASIAASSKRKNQLTSQTSLPWTEKYRPKVPNDIVGNQSLVKQLHDWLVRWNEHFLDAGKKGKGIKQNDSGAKKAVLLTGRPGIGKTTSAKLVSQMLGFQTIEVNASDSRGKADGKIERGIRGSTSNSIKELVSNQVMSPNPESSQHVKTVLIMDEVDGMSAGDRGGVADLIANIKISKIPIICICNDRYSQKLKNLVKCCLKLGFQKPKDEQEIVERLSLITSLEGIQIDKIALKELAKTTNGDIRMAVNHLQYMSLSMSIINIDDIERLKSNSKDENISPFAAVDKLFDFNAPKLQMDERINLSMSDPDLVPLLIQENYINYRPSAAAGVDDYGMKRMNLLVQAAKSIGDGDIINVQIRRHQMWQLSQNGCVASCITPAALLYGRREILNEEELNYTRFAGWLGKNSTMQKNNRLLKDLHGHLLASRESHVGRSVLRMDNLTLLLMRLTEPLKKLSKDEAVGKVVEFMELYSISMKDFERIVDLSKFKGRPCPLDGIQPAVKAALTKAYNRGSSSRVVRTADLITIPGVKKVPKKRVTAMVEDDTLTEIADNEEESLSHVEDPEDDPVDPEKWQQQLQTYLQSLNSKAIQVQIDLKGSASSSGKKSPSGRRGRGRASSATGRGGGRGSGSVSKRKR